jgi:hypothetical protein
MNSNLCLMEWQGKDGDNTCRLRAVNEASKCFFPLLGRSHKFFLADESD